MDLNLPICGCVFLFSFFFFSGHAVERSLIFNYSLLDDSPIIIPTLFYLLAFRFYEFRKSQIIEKKRYLKVEKIFQKTVKGKAGEEHIAQRRPKPSTKFSARDCNVFRLKLVPQTILNRLIQEHVSYRTVTFEDSIKIYKA